MWRLALASTVPLLLVLPSPGMAQAASGDDPSSGGVFDHLMRSMGLKADLAPAPAFVEHSRLPEDRMHYMPVGAPHRDKGIKAMTPAEVAATTADLDRERLAVQRKAGVKPVPVPLKSELKAAGSKTKTKTIR